MLNTADLVFTISEPLQDELLERGLAPRRVHWYPNCVDPDVYNTDRWSIDEINSTRASIGADEDAFVLTFVGTFGQWHGAEILAQAAVLLCQDEAWCRANNLLHSFCWRWPQPDSLRRHHRGHSCIESNTFCWPAPTTRHADLSCSVGRIHRATCTQLRRNKILRIPHETF